MQKFPWADFGQKVPLKIVDFLVDFSVDFFLLVFPRKMARKIHKIHRGNQTPKSTSNFREGVSWATPFKGGLHPSKLERYPALVLGYSQAHLCDTPFCNVSRDNVQERVLRYYRYNWVHRLPAMICGRSLRFVHAVKIVRRDSFEGFIIRPPTSNNCKWCFGLVLLYF